MKKLNLFKRSLIFGIADHNDYRYFNNYFKISDEAYIYLSDFFPNLFMSKTDSSIDIKDEIIFDNFCNELRPFVRNKLFSWTTAP